MTDQSSRSPIRTLTVSISAFLLLAGGLTLANEARAVQFPQALVVSDDPADWTPWVDDGYVETIIQVGNRVIVGGNFTSVRAPGAGSGVPRTHLFAFNATTGAIDQNFHPALNGAVNALVPSTDGLGVIAAGQFTTVNGANRRGPAEIALSNGALDPTFTATTAGGPVLTMAINGNILYVGGRFTTANGVARPLLAAFNATTGALDDRLNATFAGTINGGSTLVDALDVTPDGSRMVVIGNFTSVDQQSRPQVAQFDLTSNPFTLANWQTNRYAGVCAGVFTYWVQDVDYSPDGSYFAIVTTGAFQGGVNAGVLCDTSARWETLSVGTGLQPTWVDYAGGDSQYGVAITAAAVYVSGHVRWQNDPFAGDREGPGAVSRLGLAALDPVNGLPFRWDPQRSVAGGSTRAPLMATSQGLWFGTDVDSIGLEQHHKLAFFPLAGGTTIPPSNTGTLPGTLFSLPPSGCTQVDQSILFRVNAGGPALSSLDCGPGWTSDSGTTNPLRNTGSNSATWNQAFTVQYAPNGPVLRSTPSEVFLSERWDPAGGNELNWNFPVQSGLPLQVRVYLANQCDCTSTVGSRRFDVSLDGSLVLNDYDIVADVGNRTGTVKNFNITSDGNVDLDFAHVTENPLVNAIEIVRTDVPPVVPPPATNLIRRSSFNGVTAGAPTNFPTPGIDWAPARGAFMINGTLYTGLQDGTLHARSFNGTTFGPDTLLNPYVVSPGPVFSNVTGVFFSNGRIFYTVAGDGTMRSRYFTPESGVMGPVQFSVPANGFNWSQARGVTMANGKLYWVTPDGNLHSANFASGAPQTGTDTIVSGPGIDGQSWADTRGMFVLSSPTQGDTEDPTPPTNLHSTGMSPTQVDMAWGASTDNVGVVAYDIYRGGALLDSVPDTQTSFSDQTVTPGTFYSYQVLARDAAGNESAGSNVLNVTTPTGSSAFSDGFESGDMSNWTQVVNTTVQSGQVFAGSDAAMATSAGTRAFASRTFAQTFTSLSLDARVNVVSQGANSTNLISAHTQAGAGIVAVFRSTNGSLAIRNIVTGATTVSGVNVPLGGWHRVQVVLAIAGASSTIQVLFDGAQVNALTQTLNLGTTPIGQLVIGDSNSGRTFQVAFDEVLATPLGGGDTEDPTAPSNLQAQSVTTDQVDLAWTGSTDNVGVTSYEIRRDGAVIDSVAGTETTYGDTTVSAGTPYAYQVFAFDAAGNESAGSNVLNVTTPTGSSAFSDGFESGDMSNWTQVVNTTVQSGQVFAGSDAAMATSAGTRAFASRTFAQTFTSLSLDARVNVVSQGANSTNLISAHTQAGAGIVAVFRSTNGSLAIRNIVTGATTVSGVNVPLGGWHRVQVVLAIAGASSTIQVLFDGAQVNALTQTLNLGTTPIGRLVIGDSNSGRTFQVAFDEVVAV